MADEIKITALPANPQVVSATDLVPMVQNVSGTLTTVKVQQSAQLTYINANAQLPSPSKVTGLGTAATKAISDNALTTVAGVDGSISGGLAKFDAGASGTILDSGVPANQVMITESNLSDVALPHSACPNIFAAKNEGFFQPNLASADLVLTNPAPTWIDTSSSDSVHGIQLPPPPTEDGNAAWQHGQPIVINNKNGSGTIPLTEYDSTPIATLSASTFYILTFKNVAGDVSVTAL